MNKDLEKIRSFLSNLREEISELINLREKIYRVHFHSPMNEAWPEVKKAFVKLDDYLLPMDNIRNLEDSEEFILESLKNAGLTGTQLDLKLQAFYKSRNRWLKAKKAKFGNELVSGKPRWRKSLKSMLAWGKLIIGSLTNCLPSLKLPVEIIKEFIECLELALLDSE
jgi:hypothetical protein